MDKNLIECATCGYPLTKDERFGLVEMGGKMHKPWVGLTDEEINFYWAAWLNCVLSAGRPPCAVNQQSVPYHTPLLTWRE